MKRYENLIIGFGKAGKTLAVYLSKKGEKTALLEKDSKMYGGTCINVACIPSKFLEYNARISSKSEYDFDCNSKQYKKIIEKKRKFISKLREKNYRKVESSGVDIIDGEASFIDNKTIKVKYSNGETDKVYSERIFINTGAETIIPSIDGAEGNDLIYTSESIMELDKLPKKLVIVGGGYIGLEFASYYNNFGSEVTILQLQEEFIPREDSEISELVYNNFMDRGVRIIKGADTKSFNKNGNEVTITYEKEGLNYEISANAVLVAIGRKPNVKSLKLENAGIDLGERGEIKVDNKLKTSQANIWAMGDVKGGMQFTYISLDDYRIIRSNIENGNRTTENRGEVPYTVFIDPPLSRIGMTEREAIDKNYDIKILKLNTKDIPKAHILGEPIGLLKVIVDKNTDKILGAHIFAPQSEEIINLFKIAIDAGIKYQVLGQSIFTHPTISESLNDLLV
ncbi:FAD-dependent oxidoreductase [Eubacteriales bacterium KG127]